MKKNFNINKDVLAKVANLDVERFVYAANDKTFDVSGLIAAEREKVGMMDKVTLYSCDLKSGKVTATVCNFQLDNADALKLARQVSAFWYLAKAADVKDAADKLAEKANDVHMDMAVARDVYVARIKNAMDAYKTGYDGVKLADICQAAQNIALYYLGAKWDSFPLAVRQVAGSIYDELIRLDKIMPDVKPLPDDKDDDGHDFNIANVRDLRRLLVKFSVAFFPWDKGGKAGENGVNGVEVMPTIKKYRYKGSDARARNLYRLAAKLDKSTGRDGDVVIAKDKALMSVIIGQVLGAVQYVAPVAVPAAGVPAADAK